MFLNVKYKRVEKKKKNTKIAQFELIDNNKSFQITNICFFFVFFPFYELNKIKENMEIIRIEKFIIKRNLSYWQTEECRMEQVIQFVCCLIFYLLFFDKTECVLICYSIKVNFFHTHSHSHTNTHMVFLVEFFFFFC